MFFKGLLLFFLLVHSLCFAADTLVLPPPRAEHTFADDMLPHRPLPMTRGAQAPKTPRFNEADLEEID